MIIKLTRDGNNIVTYVNLNNVFNITENNGLFEFKQGASTVASFSVANTTVSYSNGTEIIELPRDVKIISDFILNAYAG